jgi:hypothetical protein
MFPQASAAQALSRIVAGLGRQDLKAVGWRFNIRSDSRGITYDMFRAISVRV